MDVVFDEGTGKYLRSGSMSQDNGYEIKFNSFGYVPASENQRARADRFICQLGSI